MTRRETPDEEESAAPPALELAPEYLADEEAEARVLLLIIGLPPDEVERVVSEMALDSHMEM